ncbi:hypothetical protein LCGC14_0810810 [marine sediment metagenome]|uniref:Uncharacterized protein n=1 Tax=marine sediment metagenome TaxID=412755 RepID=A0A0F9Q6Y1_9ZZZZ
MKFVLDWTHKVVHVKPLLVGCDADFLDEEILAELRRDLPRLMAEIYDKPTEATEEEAASLLAEEGFGVCKGCAQGWADSQEEKREIGRIKKRIRARGALRA